MVGSCSFSQLYDATSSQLLIFAGYPYRSEGFVRSTSLNVARTWPRGGDGGRAALWLTICVRRWLGWEPRLPPRNGKDELRPRAELVPRQLPLPANMTDYL